MKAMRHKTESERRIKEEALCTAPSLRPLSSSRSALTLIELLVVIIILTTVVGAAIPLLSPNNDDRRLREASRGLNTFITGAQTRAIVTRRPYGVAFKRLAQDTQRPEDRAVSLEVFYAEQPPPYAGFDANSRVCIALHPGKPGLALVRFATRGTTYASNQDRLPVGWDPDLFPTGLIRPGDVLEAGGTRLQLLPLEDEFTYLTADDNGYYASRDGIQSRAAVTIACRPINDSGQQIDVRYDNAGRELGTTAAPPYWTRPMPYKILRQPTLASDEPYQLPEGTAIDLRASGLGADDYFYVPGLHDNNDPVIVMFSPEGQVSRLRYNQWPYVDDIFDQPVSDSLFLLVGKRENVPPDVSSDPTLRRSDLQRATTDTQRQELKRTINWLRGESRWVVIGSQSGRIVTVENAFVDPLAIIDTYASGGPGALAESSEHLRNAQILAAREFTRDMRQLGGR